jgi:hypothetical protein
MGIIGGKIRCRHRRQSRIPPAVSNDRLKQLAGLVIQRDSRAQKVGAALLAAAQVGAVAQTTVDLI